MLCDLYLRTKKLNKYDNGELSSDMPDKLFRIFSVLRNELKLEFDHQTLERQCYIINDLLIDENFFFFRFDELCQKFQFLFYTSFPPQKKVMGDLLSFITEKFSGHKIVRSECEKKKRTFSLPSI